MTTRDQEWARKALKKLTARIALAIALEHEAAARHWRALAG
jgi:hypothetical protein